MPVCSQVPLINVTLRACALHQTWKKKTHSVHLYTVTTLVRGINSFLKAVVHHGTPSRVRTDRGGENNATCLLMNIYRGTDRGSAIRGKGTHNQRIERLWADLWHGMTDVCFAIVRVME